jgi:phospholipid/cholesterol/gamma-HCH transport system substrate-binding protein
MKKISNEVKIGATVLVVLLCFIWLFSFLRGKDIFSNKAHYYVVYDKVAGLTESSPVEINGYKVGVVQTIRFSDPESGRLLVKLSVDKGFRLPENTVAEITTATLIAGMKIQFVFGEGPGTYSSGDTIPGRLAISLITKLEDELVPLKDKAESVIVKLDSAIGSLNKIMNPKFRSDLGSGIASLSNTVRGIEKADLGASLENLRKLTGMLAENSDKIRNTFDNLESLSDTLAAADLYSSVGNLKSSLEKITELMDNLNSGTGTAGKLLTNDSLYVNLNNSLSGLNALLLDLKANPKKYVHFSMFGKKNNQSE